MRATRHLEKSAVVIWVKKTDSFKAVKEQMASIAKDEPDESTEFDGMVDLHWRFDSHAEAKRLANALREISHKPEIVVLRLSCYDDVTASVTLRDTRQRH
ncbi:MAG: hypothetical protein ACLP4V_34330 [Methylocella sp.]